MSVPISCCLWTFPISDKDPDLMEVLGYTSTESLRWDYSESEQYYILVVPPARRKRTLYAITPLYAWQWFRINGGNNLRVVYYPFSQIRFNDRSDPCICAPDSVQIFASITVEPSSVSEDGGTPMIYTVTLDEASLYETVVNFELTGTAVEGTDYDAVTHSVTIAAGLTSGTFSILPIDDVEIEGDETVIATLTDGTSGANVVVISTTAGQATGTIIELSPPPIITFVDPFHGTFREVITVIGLYFTGATLVRFIGNTALSSTASFVFVDDETLTVTVPAWPGGTSSQIDIRVTTPAGTSSVTPDDQFTYDDLYLWPEDSLDWQLIVSTGNPARMWGIESYLATSNNTVSPNRFIKPPYAYDLSDNDPVGDNWGGSGPPGQILQDSNYIYYVSNQCALISRVPVNGTFDDIQTLVIPAGFFPRGSENISVGTSAGGNWNSVIRNGKMYFPWSGKWDGNINQMGMLVVDLVAWDPAAFNFYTYSTDLANLPGSWGLCITDNGTITISTNMSGSSVDGRIYYSNVATPSTWNFITLTGVRPAFGVSKDDYAYFLERVNDNVTGIASRTTNLVVVNCTTGTPSATIVNMTDDPNFLTISQSSQNLCTFPWVSETHLFVAANHTRRFASDSSHRTVYNEHPYIAKRSFVTGATAGGTFFKDLLPWEWEFKIDNSSYYNGTHYIVCYSWSYDSRYFTVDEALTTATVWPNPTITNPAVNDLFANAITVNVNDTITGNSYYATYETGEQTPDAWANTLEWAYKPEHTVWYKFVAPATANYDLIVSRLPYDYVDLFFVSVWTGPAIGSLTLQAQHIPTDSSMSDPLVAGTFCSLSAALGTTYYIRIGRFPSATWYEGIDGLPAIDEQSGAYFTMTLRETPVTWDPATAVNMTLSNGNLTATNNFATGIQGVAATVSHTTGKFYFELTCTSVTATGIKSYNWGVGQFFTIGNTYGSYSNSHVFGAGGDQLGVLTAGGFGTIYALNLSDGLHNGDVIAVAVDLDTRQFWTKLVGGPDFPNPLGWNGSFASDPVTETGAMTVPAGTIVPMLTFNDDALTQSMTANFGGSAFIGALPAGYSAWGAGATWDPATAFKVTLSNGNLRATNQSAIEPVQIVSVPLATAKSSGKYYYEITFQLDSNNNGNNGITFGLTTATYTGLDQDGKDGMVQYESANIFANEIYMNPRLSGSLGGLSTGDVIGVAVDLDHGNVWLNMVAGPDSGFSTWNGNSIGDLSQNPSTNSGGIFLRAGDRFMPFATMDGDVAPALDSQTANFGGSAFIGPVPTGFTAGWPWGGGNSPPTVCTWDPTTAVGCTVSGGNLTVTNQGAAATVQGVKALIRKTYGKFYFEITINSINATSTNFSFGVAMTMTNYDKIIGPNNMSQVFCKLDGSLKQNGGSFGASIGTLHAGDVIGIAVQLQNNFDGWVWFKIVAGPDAAGAKWNNNVSGDPSDIFTGVYLDGNTVLPFVIFDSTDATDSVTANFGGSAFQGAVPQGFAAGWLPGAIHFTNMGWYQPLSRPLRPTKARELPYTVPLAPRLRPSLGWYQPLSFAPNTPNGQYGGSANTPLR